MGRIPTPTVFVAVAASVIAACSSSSGGEGSGGRRDGGPAASGSVTVGTSGGAGGVAVNAGGTGGASAGVASGGMQSTDGGAPNGGSRDDGGATASGGVATSGGATSSGGASASGGSTASGGATSESGLAFPGAQGFAKKTSGGRDGTVYHVTNLNDSGAGSFRDAVSSSNRIVVFDVGGYVKLATAVSVKSNITIAGQTAPGEGVGFRGGEISFASSSNIICRFIRVRPGSDTASTEDDALSLYRAHDVIIDHSSFEFAPWNDIDGVSDDWQNHPVTNITIQDSLIADPTGQQFGAHTESVQSQWAWYRNLFANSHNRNPLAKVDTVFVNNVLYNYSAGYTTHTSTEFKHDIVNNYFVFGPASTGTDNTWYQLDKNQAIYAAGNLKDTNANGALDGAATTPSWYQGTGTVLTSPWSSETTATPPLDVSSAARVAMSLAGTLPRDALDSLIVSQVMTLGKGTTGSGANTVGPDGALYTSQTETGLPNDGYGSIAGGTRPADSDNDGMSDDWERANGSDPNADDAMKKAPDGYALVEKYLNWLAAPHASTTAGMGVDVDLTKYTAGFGAVSPRYTLTSAQDGAVTLSTDMHTARFTPGAGFHGIASFEFTVNGSDGSAYSGAVTVLVVP